MSPGARPPGYGPQFHHLGAARPQASFLNTLCLGFLIYTLGDNKSSLLTGLLEDGAVVNVAP